MENDEEIEKLPTAAKVILWVLFLCLCVALRSCYVDARKVADDPNVGVAADLKRLKMSTCSNEYDTPQCREDQAARRAEAYEKDKHLMDK
jgi:hypothetical protein